MIRLVVRIAWMFIALSTMVLVLLVGLSYTKPGLTGMSDSGSGNVGNVGRRIVRPFSEYLATMGSRDLFYAEKTSVVERQSAISDETKNLLLVGIIETDQKEAIVKDKRLRQTYFVKPGDRLGDLEVVEIRKNSILLRRNDETEEVFLP